jgi:hypothetical protein
MQIEFSGWQNAPQTNPCWIICRKIPRNWRHEENSVLNNDHDLRSYISEKFSAIAALDHMNPSLPLKSWKANPNKHPTIWGIWMFS